MKKIIFPNNKQIIGSKTCGPICLLNIYSYLGLKENLEDILNDLDIDSKTTTYSAQLAKHLLLKKLDVILINSNPHITSPSWKVLSGKKLIEKIEKWILLNNKNRWIKSVKHLFYYLKQGGKLIINDLTTKLIDEYLDKNYLGIFCLEESWIWGERKIKNSTAFDDIKGEPRGHFVIIYGKKNNDYLVSDPYPTGLKNKDGLYNLNKDKLLVATLVWSGQVIFVKK